ncbi:TspO/MBR-like protein [Dendrothele bispora CBS 962.96]|uniref:TspO/MBR-like protein n=1 Tax=Dendrothele bispora (strain CBS 962.96) TaxID=1314807 RepID=A0A4S8MYT4_DENBC|nr:TspO/MBR-like protein [Dendrothele bispora CBS 962.96]
MSTIHIPAILLAIPRNPVTALGLPLALGLFSGAGTAKVVRSSWYETLAVPPGRPPRQVFPIVWPALYLSMGYASHLAVKALDRTVSPSARDDLLLGIALYYAQLSMNFVWSPLFFNFKQIGLALVDSVLLAGTTYYMTKLFDGATNSQTTYFLAPYCAWLTFATYLNGGIWWLNNSKPKRD